MSVKGFLKYFFTVRRCGGCGEILDADDADGAFCPECYLKWRVAKTATCPTCNQSAIECLCAPKGLGRTGAICLVKLYFYDAAKSGQPQNKLLYHIKRYRNKRLSDFVANELRGKLLSELSVLDIDPTTEAVLVNVPRGKSARSLHGFDQSEIICRSLSKITGIPYSNVIRRVKGSTQQKKQSKDKRFRNVIKSFKCVGNLENKYAILFDDVVTTGASMAACTKLLKKSGAKGVICVCMASVLK